MSYVFQFGTVWRELDHLLLGAWLTLRLSALAMILGLAVGIAGAQATASSSRLLRGMVQCYVEAIRNTPFLVQLLLIYLGLPSLGLRLGGIPARADRPDRLVGDHQPLRVGHLLRRQLVKLPLHDRQRLPGVALFEFFADAMNQHQPTCIDRGGLLPNQFARFAQHVPAFQSVG